MNQISTAPLRVADPFRRHASEADAVHDPRWLATRAALERDFPHGCPRYRFFSALEAVLRTGLKATGLYGRGKRNALDLRLTEIEISFPHLPHAFDGYRILQVSDIHFGGLDGLDDRALDLVGRVDADIAVLTGDYVGHGNGGNGGLEAFSAAMARLTGAIDVTEGTYAILGNHDSIRMADTFRDLGVALLGNRTVPLARGADRVHLTGIDDVYLFRTPLVDAALARKPRGFNILLAHSPHAAVEAADAGFDLYLTGHTHGGQICLPGGRPLAGKIGGPRRFNAGLWRQDRTVGYTTSGVGVSRVPVRFNTRGEIAVVTLRRRADG